MNYRNQANETLSEILRTCDEPGDVAYVRADGTWDLGRDGCQPGSTQCVSYEDIQAVPINEITENLVSFFENMAAD